MIRYYDSNNNRIYIFFTACNRTLYGEVDTIYQLELHRPKEDRLPYVCMLTFTAAGGTLGDLVQV